MYLQLQNIASKIGLNLCAKPPPICLLLSQICLTIWDIKLASFICFLLWFGWTIDRLILLVTFPPMRSRFVEVTNPLTYFVLSLLQSIQENTNLCLWFLVLRRFILLDTTFWFIQQAKAQRNQQVDDFQTPKKCCKSWIGRVRLVVAHNAGNSVHKLKRATQRGSKQLDQAG